MTGKHNLNRPDYERLIYLNMSKADAAPEGCAVQLIIVSVFTYLLFKFIFFY